MKTKIITGLKKEILLIEFKEGYELAGSCIDAIFYYDNQMNYEDYPLSISVDGNYTLLGKPDEIKEEVIEELVDTFDFNYYVDYNHPSRGAYTVTALESFFSAIEKEITWVNPILNPSDIEDYHPTIDESIVAQNKFDKAQGKTFDRNKTLIFVKN